MSSILASDELKTVAIEVNANHAEIFELMELAGFQQATVEGSKSGLVRNYFFIRNNCN